MDLDKLKAEKEEITEFLAKPEAFSNPDFAAKSRRLSELNEIIETADNLAKMKNDLDEAKALSNDPELGELAKADVEKLTANIAAAEEKLEEMLIPRDPNAWYEG